MRYVKLNLTFGDKMRLLFLGVVAEHKLPEVTKIVQVQNECKPQKSVQPSKFEVADDINTDEDFHIPFFGEEEDVKTNF